MPSYPPTIVYRHRRENLKKCSLRGLEKRADFQFFSYPNQNLPALPSYILLELDAPPLTKEDQAYGLLVLDATWRYAEKMYRCVQPQQEQLIRRSLPSHFRTAYPRKQEDCMDPDRGLASVEAIYLAYSIMGRPTDGLLDHYYWAQDFLQLNKIL